MADELIDKLNEPSEAEKRIKQLSNKVKEEAEGRETEKVAREAAEAKVAETTRERDFYQGFTDMVASNPAAKDHKDDILTKVKSGYTIEDATYAVLGKAGKLGAPKAEERVQVAGGSATTSPPQGGIKPLSEMSREEKLSALKDAESRGDLSIN